MKESILYINLLNRPTSRDGKGKNSTYHCRLYDKTVGFVIIDPWLLMKSLGHKPCFIALDWSISMALDSEHPFAPNNIVIQVWRNKSPSLIFEKCIKLNVHGLVPMGVFGSSGEASGFMVIWEVNGDSDQCLWKRITDCAVSWKLRLGNVVFGSCEHGMSWSGFGCIGESGVGDVEGGGSSEVRGVMVWEEDVTQIST